MKVLMLLVGIISVGTSVENTQSNGNGDFARLNSQENSVGGTVAPCELHVFPTTEIIDSSADYYSSAGTGVIGALVGGALTSAQSSGSGKLRVEATEQMQAYLTPEAQIDELKTVGVVSILKLPSDTEIVAESPYPALYEKTKDSTQIQAYKEYWGAIKNGSSLRQTNSPCYRELIILSISVSKNLGNLKFSSSFVYRTFDSQHSETHLYDGDNSLPKPERFPAQSSDGAPEASAALRDAFGKNFTNWVARRVKF